MSWSQMDVLKMTWLMRPAAIAATVARLKGLE
jgi:hypothetical protein